MAGNQEEKEREMAVNIWSPLLRRTKGSRDCPSFLPPLLLLLYCLSHIRINLEWSEVRDSPFAATIKKTSAKPIK